MCIAEGTSALSRCARDHSGLGRSKKAESSARRGAVVTTSGQKFSARQFHLGRPQSKIPSFTFYLGKVLDSFEWSFICYSHGWGKHSFRRRDAAIIFAAVACMDLDPIISRPSKCQSNNC